MKASTSHLILSCEHGGNHIPVAYRHLFRKGARIIGTHRGLDIGALTIAKAVAQGLSAPLLYSETSRLLVDLNRSPHHRKLFSEFTRNCNDSMREDILRKYYFPYRQVLEQQILDTVADGYPVLHLSIHSFTPVLAGQIRNAGFGLLYDPARKMEKSFCANLQDSLNRSSNYVTRMNYPYRGSADGLTTWLRKKLPALAYFGIEIEINQGHILNDCKSISRLLVESLREVMTGTGFRI